MLHVGGKPLCKHNGFSIMGVAHAEAVNTTMPGVHVMTFSASCGGSEGHNTNGANGRGGMAGRHIDVGDNGIGDASETEMVAGNVGMMDAGSTDNTSML